MNIFVLDKDPRIAARYHCDIHVRTMIKESAQLLSVAHRILDKHQEPFYKLTHVNHPCSIWTRESSSNYEWLYELFVSLHYEYTQRFRKNHRSYILLNAFLKNTPENIPDKGITQFAQAMPIEYRCQDAVLAYRTYYCNNKLHFCKWSKPTIKPWWVSHFLMTKEIKHRM